MEHYLRSVHSSPTLSVISAARGLSPADGKTLCYWYCSSPGLKFPKTQGFTAAKTLQLLSEVGEKSLFLFVVFFFFPL